MTLNGLLCVFLRKNMACNFTTACRKFLIKIRNFSTKIIKLRLSCKFTIFVEKSQELFLQCVNKLQDLNSTNQLLKIKILVKYSSKAVLPCSFLSV